MKGVKLPNVSRLLVYKLGGTVQLPAERAVTAPPIDPPANEATGEVTEAPRRVVPRAVAWLTSAPASIASCVKA